MSQNIREKIEHLIRLAERPGTPSEGENARQKAIELSLKYGIPCKFTKVKPKATPGPGPSHGEQYQDSLMNPWVTALDGLGWHLREEIKTKIGRQFRFRKNSSRSEIRVTQRKSGFDFEAEHIISPDPTPDGYDMSYTTYMTVHLKELLNHLS